MKDEKCHTVRIGLRYNRNDFLKMVRNVINRTSDAYYIVTPYFNEHKKQEPLLCEISTYQTQSQ